MRRWRPLLLALITTLLPVTLPAAGHPKHHINRKDPAFIKGYDDGYREGANDCQALSHAYRDHSGSLYAEAIDGYTPKYGDEEAYQRRFRRGYVEGYKAGWDFNAGAYNVVGEGK